MSDINDLNQEEQIKLLKLSLDEITEYLGEIPYSTISASLWCLTHGVSSSEQDKMMLAFKRLAISGENSVDAFDKYEKVVSEYYDGNHLDIVTTQLISGFSNYSVPELKPLSNELISSLKLSFD